MGKVVDFTGITKGDLDSDAVLEAAKGNVTDVIVLGYDKDELEYFASAKSDAKELLWLVKRYEKYLLELADIQDE